jgi:hypothetical protein
MTCVDMRVTPVVARPERVQCRGRGHLTHGSFDDAWKGLGAPAPRGLLAAPLFPQLLLQLLETH